ncbi:MAG: hypothetical protein N2657_04965 [bacterium]|nr:hypothetical protein [bacterium]
MYISSHGLTSLSSPNLKYFGLFYNNKFYLYRERTFITEVEITGIDTKVISLSDKAELLVLQNNELKILYFSEKDNIETKTLNQYFKEGGKIQDFSLLPKENKIFFTRITQDKSIFSKLTKKGIIIQELGVLNISTKREEIILTKKVDKQEDLFIFKLSPLANYILVADPQKMSIQKINLINYVEELSFSIENVEILDFFINNEGDCAFILQEQEKKGIYFISKTGTKYIIKTDHKIEDYTIVNFNPLYFILKHKSYPEVLILDKYGNKFLNFLTSQIDNLGYIHWVIIFPNYEDIITLYLKQMKLPLDMFFYSYSNFKAETIRWQAAQQKQKVKETKIYENIEQKILELERENIINQKVSEDKIQKTIEEKIPEQKTSEYQTTIEDTTQKKINIKTQNIDENIINQRILEEVKTEAKEIKYDTSIFLKFLEEAEKEAETPTKLSPIKQTKPEKTEENKESQKPKEIPSHKIQIPKEENISPKKLELPEKISIPNLTQKEISNVQKTESIQTKKIELTETEKQINIEHLLSKIEKKIEKKLQEEPLSEKVLSQQIQTEEITIEIKKQITPEDIKKLQEEKENILKKINELKFLKSIGEITEEEYENRISELKKSLEKIKEKLQKMEAT